MATDDTTTDDFRTGNEISRPAVDVRRGADAIRVCEPCSRAAGRTKWTGHEMREDGSYRCLACPQPDIPESEQATDADVRESLQDHDTEGSA